MFLPLLPSNPYLQGTIFRRQEDLMCFGSNNPLDSRCRLWWQCVPLVYYINKQSHSARNMMWLSDWHVTVSPSCSNTEASPQLLLAKKVCCFEAKQPQLQTKMHMQQVLSVQRQQLNSPPVTSSLLPGPCQAPWDAADVPHSQALHPIPMNIFSID